MYNEWRINLENSVAKASWAERSSFKLVCGCLHGVCKCENGQTSRVLIVVPKVRIPGVHNVQYKGQREGYLGEIEAKFFLVESVMERIAKYEESWPDETVQFGSAS